MKTKLLGLGLCALLGSTHAPAQPFAIDWFTVGAGGTSAGVRYAVSGAVVHANGNGSSGGSFSVQGGFWTIAVVPTPGAPLLRIQLVAPNSVLIAWPASADGFALQETTDLATPNW